MSVEPELIVPVMENMAASEAVIAEDVEGVEMAGRAMRAFYHPALYYTEIGLAAQIRRRLNQEPAKPLSREKIAAWLHKAGAGAGFALSEEQREAVHLALEKRFLVLTGGPGTGKTVHHQPDCPRLRRAEENDCCSFPRPGARPSGFAK